MIHLFGSSLIKHYFSDFRNPRDVDFVTNSYKEVEAFSTNENEEIYCIPFLPDRMLTSHEIYTVKVSHAIYDINWKKHISDIRFLQLKHQKIDLKLLNDLREFWLTIHTAKKYTRVDFNIPAEDFFKDNVQRKIPHDELHLLIKNPPAYFEIAEGIIPIESKFNDSRNKDAIVLEEAYVIGLERFNHTNYRDAYINAQQALVTRLHPIFIADYVIENWHRFYTAPQEYQKLFERLKHEF
jgi:hypothetical protein